MKKLIRLLGIEAAAVAGLGAVLALLLLRPLQPENQQYTFSQRPATEIASILVENEGGGLRVTAQDGGYLLEDVPSELVDMDAFISLLTVCAEVSSQRQVAPDWNSLKEYGLDQPQAQVEIAYQDGESLVLRLGSQEPLSRGYYCTVEGEKGVYLMEEEGAQHWLLNKESLISLWITPPLAVSSALSAIRDVTFTGGPLEEPVAIESVAAGDEEVKKLARSFGAVTHIVRGAGVYELDQSYGLEMLTPLCGMKGQSVYAYGLSGEEEETLMGQPEMQVEFDYQNGSAAEHYILRFRPAEDGSLFYANAKGSGVIYVVERPPFFDICYEKLLLRWLLSPLLMDISGVSIEMGQVRCEFLVDNTDGKNPVVTLNGAPVDTALFRNLFQLLCSAAGDGDYLGPQPPQEGEPAARITYHYPDGKGDDVLALYPGGSRRMNAYVNGVCEFAMKDAFVERLGEALTAIQAGDPFDINW